MTDGIGVLIVDGNPDSRVPLTMALVHEQYRVTAAASGQNGLMLAWRDHPDVIFINMNLPEGAVDFLLKLRADKRTEATPCIGYSREPTNEQRVGFLEAGGNAFTMTPAAELQDVKDLIQKVTGATDQTGEGAEKMACSIVFLSAKGGTGTSSLCVNIANGIARTRGGSQLVVADLVLPIGSIGPIVGYDGRLNLASIAAMPEGQVNTDYLQTNLPFMNAWNFHLLAGAPDPQHANEVRADRVLDLVTGLRHSFDLVLIDLGRSLSRISMPIIHDACVVVLVMATDASSVGLTKTIWDYLREQGVEERRVYTVLNRAVGLEGLTKAEAETVVGLPIQATFPYMGGNFALANNRHEPILTKFPTDTAAFMLQQVCTQIPQLAERVGV
jgi:Flp pilus assembly CpaE family ATPase